MEKRLITVTGDANELYTVSQNGEMKQTRLFYLMPEDLDGNSETIDISITSTNPFVSFPIFDKMLGKKIRISVDIID
jgi:hypothetical protein